MDDPVTPVERSVRRAPAPFAMMLVMFAVPAIAVAAWFVLPSTGAAVAVVGVLVLAAVFLGIWRVLSLRRLEEPPQRRPVRPPSAS